MVESQTSETLLQNVLDLADSEERAAYLDEACGEDEALRREVESLLAAHLEAGGFMEGAGGFMETLADPRWEEMPTAKEGDRVGRYLILERIAEGGFGVVFRAEQQEPVKRVVALKVIKPGMDSKEVVKRFELERQALAMMDHSNIARVYDAGTTERGRPYFVMELVDGRPLTEFCDEHELDIRGRLKLFAQICVAVQHAHQKGIIHRDLKPSNILVGESGDGSPFPKVIDFGVAKAISPELTKETCFTVFGRMMGTPRYMSPEQAELNTGDIDTRSDIYSLGVILYELVTGSAPLREKKMSSASFDEVRQMIRESEPVKPSDRVLELTEAERREAAQTRQLDEGKFWRQLKGDLDWIVMKALAKDRDRRYDTAQGLAVDVRRYLRGLPVSAGPPGTAYRLSKFVRRNRWPVMVGVLTMLTLLAVAVAIAMGYFVVRAQRDQVSTEREFERVESLVRGVSKVRNLRADVSGSRGEALRILGEVGLYPPEEIVRLKGDSVAQELRNDARNELIACLHWTDLHESRLLEGLEIPWPPAVLDSKQVHCALSRQSGQLEVIRAATGDSLAAREGLGGDIKGPLRFNSKGDMLAARIGSPGHWKLVVWKWAEDRLVTEGLAGVNDAFDFHPDGNGFVMGTREGTLQLFDADGNERGTPLALVGEPAAIRFSPDGRSVAVSVKSSGIVVIDLSTGEKSGWWDAGRTISLAWAPNGQALVAGGEDGSVTVLERSSGKSIFSVKEHLDPVDQVAWSHDGLLIASGSQDGVIQLWDSRQGDLLCKFPAWARTLSFSQDDRSLGPVTPETDKQALSILEVQRSPICHRTAGHSAESIAATVWNTDGTVLATGAEDGLRLWNRRGAELKYFPNDRVQPGGLACSRTHLYLAESQGISRRVMRVSAGRLECGPKVPLGDLAGGKQIGLSPDGSYLAVAHNTEVVLLDAENGELRRRLPAPDTTTSLAISPDGAWVAAGTREGSTVRVWDLTEDEESVQDLPVDGAAAVAFFPVARHPSTGLPLPTILMTGDGAMYRQWRWDRNLEKWVEKAQRPSEMADRLGRLAHIAYSPRGTALVVSYNRKYLQVLNPKTLEVMAQPGFEEQWPLAVSPDGGMLTTEAAKGRLFLWNLAEARKELKLRGLDWELRDFPPDTIPVIAP